MKVIILTSQKSFKTLNVSSPDISGNAKNSVSTDSTPSSHMATCNKQKTLHFTEHIKLIN